MTKAELKESKLYNSSNEPEAVSVSLNDLKVYIDQCFPGLNTSVHLEDYDDHGCDHYLLIRGECANIILKKNLGGIFSPTDKLECSVEPHEPRDIDTTRTTHTFYFKDGQEPKFASIADNYAENIHDYLAGTIKYLTGTADLFTRVDTHYFSDGTGVHKSPNTVNRYSYTNVYVKDEDFYVDLKLKTDIESARPDVDKQFEAVRAQERYVFNTQMGTIFITGPLENITGFSDPMFDKSLWTATHAINDQHPATAQGKTLKQAYSKLYDDLAAQQKKAAWYALIRADDDVTDDDF